MQWRVVRIDFTERCACVFGSKTHYITSGKGYVVVDVDGNEKFSGPNCARNPDFVVNPNENVPDLTKGCLEPEGEDSGPKINVPPEGTGRATKAPIVMSDRCKQNAVAYLILRVEKLKHFKKIKYQKLDVLYERYNNSDLTDSDYYFLNRLVDAKDFPEYSLKNLQAIYACDFWINQFIKNERNKDLTYVESCRSYLHRKLALTPSQIIGLNNWFDNSNGRKMVRLKSDFFVINPGVY